MSTVAPTALPDALGDASREFVSKQHALLIGQERSQAADGRTFATLDPSNGAEIASVPQAGAEDVDRAVAAARAAFEQGPWASMAPSERSRLMNALADALDARAQEIAEIESLDNGKPVKLARFVDVAGTIAHLRYFAGWATKIEGAVLPVTAPGMLCYTRREPVGVCGQIVPWNFPLLMASWKVAPALAAGCTVVLKPAEQTPLSALRLGELALEVGFPPGVLNVITGDGETGAALVDHPGVDKISFTGSTAVGRQIGAKAGRALKRVTLELGGKSPNVILPDADIDAAVKGSYQAIYFNSGQACNAGSRLFVPKERFDEVVGALAERAQATRLGAGLDPDTQLGPLVSAEQQQRVMSYIDSGRASKWR
jgi:aldehyde dehydrogenase (NAD+)